MTSDYQKRQQDNHFRLLEMMGDSQPDSFIATDKNGKFKYVKFNEFVVDIRDRVVKEIEKLIK